jgi:Fur family ferric uptake transcriptional regulator
VRNADKHAPDTLFPWTSVDKRLTVNRFCMSFERTECILHKISPGSFPRRKQQTWGHSHLRERPKKQPDVLFEEALNYLKAGGFRLTKPREIIVRAAISFSEPFHAEDLLAKARVLEPEISLATTYRTLPMLLDSHLIREVELNREHRYYEVNREQSPAAFHIICSDCEQVIQVQDECIMLRERFLANSLGFKPLKLNVRIEAACLDLHEKGTCERRGKTSLETSAAQVGRRSSLGRGLPGRTSLRSEPSSDQS